MGFSLQLRAAGILGRLRDNVWLRPLNDISALDDWLGTINPTWSLTAVRARVIDVIRETARARTLVLQPNRLWRGFRAGQHVAVDVEIDGRRHTRVFSLSSAPSRDGRVAITVQHRPGGIVSAWWTRHAARGDVVTLGEPRGSFVLPDALPRRLHLLSAGSGITPVMSLVRALGSRRGDTSVRWIHTARDAADVLFAGELAALSRAWPSLDLRIHLSRAEGRLSAEAFAALAADCGAAPAFVCGPAGFVERARAAWASAGLAEHLRIESFGLPPHVHTDERTHTVRSARSRAAFAAHSGSPLLVAAEAAGLEPAYGCRAGICHACKCRKIDGAVRDLRTGAISDLPNEMIQLCVSAACSELTLDL